MKPINMDDLRLMYQEALHQIDEVKLYFELKKRKMIRKSNQLACVKAVIGLYMLKMPITSTTFAWAHQRGRDTSLSVLHAMGDRKLLLLKRKPGAGKAMGDPYDWMIHPYFLDVIKLVVPGRSGGNSDEKDGSAEAEKH